MLPERELDTFSTVTDILTANEHQIMHQPRRNSNRSQRLRRHPSSKDEKSSTNELKKYIKNYNRTQTWDLAEAMSHDRMLHRRTDSDKENELNKEIDYARNLLHSTCGSITINEDTESLKTDDLLTMDPTIAGFKILEKATLSHGITPSNVEPIFNSTPRKVHDCKHESTPYCFAQVEKQCILTAKALNPMSHNNITEGDSSLDIFTLNGIPYTPHKIKFKLNSQESTRSYSEAREEPVRFDLACDTSLETSTTLNSNNANAGRTPFRICQQDKRSMENENEISQSLCCSTTTASSTHYSVPLRLNGKTPQMMNFMQECLSEDFEAPSIPRGSVETLKNMLFTLQTISPNDNDELQSAASTECSPSKDSMANRDGHSSLKCAISHLSNLREHLT